LGFEPKHFTPGTEHGKAGFYAKIYGKQVLNLLVDWGWGYLVNKLFGYWVIKPALC
jgi:hypothetical protein